MKNNNILLLGGSGFIGKQLAFVLANRGWLVTIPSRRPHRNRDLLVHPNIRVIESDIFNQVELRDLCEKRDAIVNLVGILHERKKGDFRKVHIDFIKALVSSCSRAGCKRLVHVSALAANQSTGSSEYLRTKGEGETLMHTFGQRDLQVTSFQPSVVFGHSDQFINRFASILKYCFGFFPLACASSKFAPVYVGDLANRIADSINNSASFGKRYEVVGPEEFSLRQICELIIAELKLPCRVLPLGNGISKVMAFILDGLPGNIFTLDNYRSLQTDSTSKKAEPCQTSLRQYVTGLSEMFSNRADYDRFRSDFANSDMHQGKGADIQAINKSH